MGERERLPGLVRQRKVRPWLDSFEPLENTAMFKDDVSSMHTVRLYPLCSLKYFVLEPKILANGNPTS